MRHTVVLVARRDCFACQESVGFYKTLTRQLSSMPEFTFVVLSPDSPDVMRQWLNAQGVEAEFVAQVQDPPASGLYLTPILLVLDPSGVVDAILAARLLPAEEQRMLARLASDRVHELTSNVPDEIDEAQLTALQQAGQVQLLDGRERSVYLQGHRQGSMNIPFRQLPIRASLELSAARRLILDCQRDIAASCPGMGTFLRQSGFGHVSLLFSGLDARE